MELALAERPSVREGVAGCVQEVGDSGDRGVAITRLAHLADEPTSDDHAIGDLFPKRDWSMLSHHLFWHGRRRCHARNPACGACPLARLCPSYGEGPVDPVVAAKLVKTEGRA